MTKQIITQPRRGLIPRRTMTTQIQPAPIIDAETRPIQRFRMNRYAWFVALSFALFAAVFTNAIASQAWEYAVVFAGAFAAGCMVAVFGAVIVVWVGTHRG